MHNLRIVHRDVKPENVLLSAGGVVKICDFGASRLFSPDQTQLEMSTGIGTVWYQAPEMLMSSNKYGTEVDIWSVGKCAVTLGFAKHCMNWPIGNIFVHLELIGSVCLAQVFC